MNSLERVVATLTGQHKDKPAVTLTLSLFGAGLIDCPLQEYYTDPEKYFQGQSAVKEKINPDILFTPFMLISEGQVFGSKVKYFKTFPPNMESPVKLSVDDFINRGLPDFENHPSMIYIKEATRKMVSKFGNNTAIAGITMSPADSPALIFGIAHWLEIMLFEPEKALKVMEITTDFFVKRANEFFADGAHFIVLPVVFCNPLNITLHIAKSVVIPVMEKAFSQIKGPIVIHHVGTTINHFLYTLQSLPNVAAFVVDRKDKLSVSRKEIGDSKLLLGNIDGPTLNMQSVEILRNYCNFVLNDRKDNSRFILATSAADVPINTPIENIQTIIDSTNNFKYSE